MKQEIPLSAAVPRPFRQVDVFSPQPFRGIPLAVVHNAGGLTDQQMQQFATWTNLSETTFLVPPADPAADYGVRIYTPDGELPFAGHPTLGSAHAWLEAGGTPAGAGGIVQECAAGLVRLQNHGGRLAFAAPPLTRYGPVAETQMQQIAAALDLPRAALVDASWLVNGPEWIGVLLGSAEEVLAVRPNYQAMAGLEIGILGPYSGGGSVDFEVRTFIPGDIPVEDPVTGSFNAGAAQWLISSGRAPESYVASQGTVLGRAGRVHVRSDGTDVWVGGDCRTRISGTVTL
ncbi:PhzF family phenazine biosynthesis protein [Arthrobacter luteolus]|uniref:PhzF family phenazine biosynthesis protein n=1 Tax=Arthrobacter luteolus TaxID=98672 RepID=UPI000A8365F0|nr:PhzF family phenazine biosynthesis protein [Arthrobacter luteolus]